MKKLNLTYIIALLLGIFLFSCREAEVETSQGQNEKTLSVFASTRSEEDGDDDLVTMPNGITDILNDNFVEDYSLIYISQRGPDNVEPAFDNPDSDNLYTYSYYENPAATWESGYNFAPFGDKELDWKNIEDIGMIGNGYIFFSMYFPEDNKIRFFVESDQSDLKNLRRSNVLGALHTTDKIDSRLRFKFYHLMAFLNVTLYVPVFDESDNSGFLENALDKGTVLNINPNFSIDYSIVDGADQSLMVGLDGNNRSDVEMFIHEGSESTTINVAEFYPNSDIETDNVRKYTLSVLMPAGQNIQEGDFLRFQLHTPGGTVKKYVFSTSIQSINLQIEKGLVTQLGLYIPRKENNTILIDTEILDWNKSSSEMNLVEETVNK